MGHIHVCHLVELAISHVLTSIILIEGSSLCIPEAQTGKQASNDSRLTWFVKNESGNNERLHTDFGTSPDFLRSKEKYACKPRVAVTDVGKLSKPTCSHKRLCAMLIRKMLSPSIKILFGRLFCSLLVVVPSRCWFIISRNLPSLSSSTL